MNWTRQFSKPEGALGRVMLDSMNLAHTPVAKWGLTHYDWKPDTRALDIGCGGGMNLKRMLKLSPQGKVFGIDISNESVIKSKKVNLSELGRRCTVKRASADAVPFDDRSFDVVTAFETIYFWPDLPHALKEVLRVLKPGGSFLVVCEETKEENVWEKLVDHMKAYSPEQIGEWMKNAGFEQIEIDCPRRKRMCVCGKKPV